MEIDEFERYFNEICKISMYDELGKEDGQRKLYWDVPKDGHLHEYIGTRLEKIPEARKKNEEKIVQMRKELEIKETEYENIEDDAEKKEEMENEMNHLVGQINYQKNFPPDLKAADLMAEAYRTDSMHSVFFKLKMNGHFIDLSLRVLATSRGVQKSLEDIKIVV